MTPGNESTPHSGVDASWHNPALLQSGSPLNSDNHEPSISVQQPHDDSLKNLNTDKEHPKFDFLVDSSHRSDRMQTGANEARGSPSYQHSSMNYDWGASIHPRHENSTPLSSGSPLPLPPTQQHHYARYTPDPSSPSQTPAVGVDPPIKHVPATCPIDGLLLNFMHERRQRLAEGMPACEVVGPEKPSVASLLNPGSDAYSHPVSKVLTDILSKLSALALDRLPERVAALHVMFYVSKCFFRASLSLARFVIRQTAREREKKKKKRGSPPACPSCDDDDDDNEHDGVVKSSLHNSHNSVHLAIPTSSHTR